MAVHAVPSPERIADARAGRVDMKLEVVTIPVRDVELAKAFYGGLGWRLDADFTKGGGRVVQFTPPGSACSVHLGENLTSAAPGSAQGLFLVVSDIQAAREELAGRGAPVSEVFHFAGFDRVDANARLKGPAPDRSSYGSFLSFRDPDGNGWLLQEITTRLPGRVVGATSFTSADDLAGALRRAAAAHGEHEKRLGAADPDWPDWYAAWLAAEQSGGTPPR